MRLQVDKQSRAHLLPGTRLSGGRYLIQSVLGSGGFGITYLGLDCGQNQQVAIKEYLPNGMAFRDAENTNDLMTIKSSFVEQYEKGKARFLKEAQHLAKFLEEPGIVGVLDYFEENRTAYMVMEYLDGMTLEQALKEQGKFPIDTLLRQMEPLLDSLENIHKSGLIHRDISPDNIMITKNGKMVLIDFGAARVCNLAESANFSVVLKLRYAPLEQYNPTGQGAWTDVYALCATIYHCITGRPPLSVTFRAQKDDMVWPSQLGVPISPKQEAALRKGMSIQREQRYQSVEALKADLYGKQGRHRRQWPWMVGCAAAALVLLGAVLLTGQRQMPEPPAAVSAEQTPPQEPVPVDFSSPEPVRDASAPETTSWQIDPCKIVLSGEDMTAAEFETASEILEARLACLTSGAYTMEVSGQSIALQLPKSALSGYETSKILKCYLSHAMDLFVFDRSKAQGIDAQGLPAHFALERSDLESVTLHTGHLPGIDAAALGIETEEYPYIEIVLTEACVEKHASEIASWGNSLAFGQDLETCSTNGFYYYHTFPSADRRRFYLVDHDVTGPFSELLVFNLTHDPLPQSFTYQILDDFIWEQPEDGESAGVNQYAPDALEQQAENLVSLVYEYDPDRDAELTQEEIEATLKLRFDALSHPYAYGKSSGNENSFVFRISADYINLDCAELLCAPSGSVSLQSGMISMFANNIASAEAVEQSDGSYALRLRLKDIDFNDSAKLEYLTGSIADQGGGTLYLLFGKVYFASRPIDAPISNGCLYFDQCCLANLASVGPEQKYLYELAALLCSAEHPLQDVALRNVIFDPDSPAMFGLPASQAEEEFPSIVKAICQAVPDASVDTGNGIIYVELDLPVDEQLPETFANLTKEIFLASDLEHSLYHGLTVSLALEDALPGEIAHIDFVKYCRPITRMEETSPRNGYVFTTAEFQGGRLAPYEEAFAECMQTNPFYVSDCMTFDEFLADMLADAFG